MRRMLSAVMVASALAGQAGAQVGVKETDRVYGKAELAGLLSGHAVEYFDGSISRYRDDGAYSYKYREDDRPHLGTYEVVSDGRVCVDFLNGSSRCDSFVFDGQRMVLIIAGGTRFPVRRHRELVNDY